MPEDLLWERNMRTKAKHDIIKEYLKAWFPIITRYEDRVLYFEGFSGPGEYDKGEEGSPLIAIKTALEHSYNEVQNTEIIWMFADTDAERLEYLQSKINEELCLPDKWDCAFLNTSFADQSEKMFEILKKNNSELIPSFIFIDPFGVKDYTLEHIKNFMKNDKCEIMINFMYEYVNRFINNPDEKIRKIITDLFGTDEWEKIIEIKAPQERNREIRDLFHKQLCENANVKFVRDFELRRGNRPSYYLVFCTNNKKGLEKMIDAMWKVDPSGNYKISDNTYDKNVLFEPIPNWNKLKKMMIKNFNGKQVRINDLLDWVLIEASYRKSGVKKNVLKPLEKEGIIDVIKSERSRSFSYPKGTVLYFNTDD